MNLSSDSTGAVTSAITMVEAYSAGPGSSASFDSSGDSVAMMTTLTQPAQDDPNAAIESAGPARPWRAIGWPSRQITTEVGSPGMLSMIAVVEPAWWPP